MSTVDFTVGTVADSILDFAKAHKTTTQLILLVLSAVGFGLMFSPTTGVLLTLIVFVHELGHYIPARRYGVGKGMYMLPMLGGVTLSDGDRYKRLTSYQRFIIVFCGPATGLFFTLVGLMGWYLAGSLTCLTAAYISSVLNFTNLLPLWILDGRKLLDLFAASGARARTVAITCLQAVGILLVFTGSSFGFYAVFGVLFYVLRRAQTEPQRMQMRGVDLRRAYLLYALLTVGLALPFVVIAMHGHVYTWYFSQALALTTFGWIVTGIAILAMISVPLLKRYLPK